MTLKRSLIVGLVLATASACGPSLATRYAAGNQALSTPDGAVYFVLISPILQRALNACIPATSPSPSPVMVVVADIAASGEPSSVDVEPGSTGTDCIRRHLSDSTFPKPPLAPGANTFPIGIRIDDAK